MSNVGELDRVRRHLRAHPDLHDQGTFACGTAGCVAGWAVALHGGASAGQVLRPYIRIGLAPALLGIPSAARGILGLTWQEGQALFFDTLDEDDSNAEALLLIDALIARDKGEDLCDADREILTRYGLPVEPAGDQP